MLLQQVTRARWLVAVLLSTWVHALLAQSGTHRGLLASECSADIIVIGAGISGLAAAKDLRAAGMSVVVLEGRNRTGGRIWTVQTKGGAIDAGGAWIHGWIGNPLTEYVNSLKLKVYNTTEETTVLYNAATGNPFTPAELERFEELAVAWTDYLDNQEEEEGVSVGSLLQDFLDSSDAEELELTAADQLLLEWAARGEYELDFAGPISTLDWVRANENEAYDGKDQWLDAGYVSIINHLAEGSDIRLNHLVTAVAQSPTEGVTVTAQDQVTKAEVQCKGRYALVTVPLGVLKKGSITFTPPLPATKQAAITGMDMGLLNKVIMVFDAPFWDEDVDWMLRLDNPTNSWPGFFSMTSASGRPVIIGFVAADAAWALDNSTKTDAEILGEAMEALRSMFGEDVPAQPVESLVTHWGRDPFAYGAYSFIPITAPENPNQALAARFERIAFAGEACNQTYPSTVHGALGSGRRQAAQLIELAKKDTLPPVTSGQKHASPPSPPKASGQQPAANRATAAVAGWQAVHVAMVLGACWVMHASFFG